jgi:hypothetical protein
MPLSIPFGYPSLIGMVASGAVGRLHRTAAFGPDLRCVTGLREYDVARLSRWRVLQHAGLWI